MTKIAKNACKILTPRANQQICLKAKGNRPIPMRVKGTWAFDQKRKTP